MNCGHILVFYYVLLYSILLGIQALFLFLFSYKGMFFLIDCFTQFPKITSIAR